MKLKRPARAIRSVPLGMVRLPLLSVPWARRSVHVTGKLSVTTSGLLRNRCVAGDTVLRGE